MENVEQAVEIENTEEESIESTEDVSGADDPDESFADWKARTSGEPKEEKEEVKAKEEEKEEVKTPEVKLYNVKAHGQEYEVEEKDVPQLLAKAIGADVALEQAAGVQKSAREFVANLKENPIETIMGLNIIDRDKFLDQMEEVIFERIQYKSATDAERKAIDNEKELKQLKGEQQQTKAQQKAEQDRIDAETNNKEVAGHREEFGRQIHEEITFLGLDPNDQHLKEMFVKYMMPNLSPQALKNNPNFSAKDITAKVKAELAHLSEVARKQKVEEFKAKKPEEPKKKEKEVKQKKFSSIYDLLE